MALSLNAEIWGMALWVEKHHGHDYEAYIEAKIALLDKQGEPDGADLWRKVARRYSRLTPIVPIHGQPETQPN